MMPEKSRWCVCHRKFPTWTIMALKAAGSKGRKRDVEHNLSLFHTIFSLASPLKQNTEHMDISIKCCLCIRGHDYNSY